MCTVVCPHLAPRPVTGPKSGPHAARLVSETLGVSLLLFAALRVHARGESRPIPHRRITGGSQPMTAEEQWECDPLPFPHSGRRTGTFVGQGPRSTQASRCEIGRAAFHQTGGDKYADRLCQPLIQDKDTSTMNQRSVSPH
jgi:hypothetical protein